MSERKSFTPKQRQAVYAKTQGHCAYCGQEITIKQMQVDHIIAVEHAHFAGELNAIKNLFPACRPCNYIKSTMSVEKFRLYVEDVTASLERNNVTYRNALRFGRLTVKKTPCVFYFETIGLTAPQSIFDEIYRERHAMIWFGASSGEESEGEHAE